MLEVRAAKLRQHNEELQRLSQLAYMSMTTARERRHNHGNEILTRQGLMTPGQAANTAQASSDAGILPTVVPTIQAASRASVHNDQLELLKQQLKASKEATKILSSNPNTTVEALNSSRKLVRDLNKQIKAIITDQRTEETLQVIMNNMATTPSSTPIAAVTTATNATAIAATNTFTASVDAATTISASATSAASTFTASVDAATSTTATTTSTSTVRVYATSADTSAITATTATATATTPDTNIASPSPLSPLAANISNINKRGHSTFEDVPAANGNKKFSRSERSVTLIKTCACGDFQCRRESSNLRKCDSRKCMNQIVTSCKWYCCYTCKPNQFTTC